MDILKKIFPLSFRFTGSVSNLVIGVIIYLAASAVLGVLLCFVGQLPLMKLVADLTSSLVGVYCTGGIVIMFLYHFHVLKD
ncbi:MAG: hypothetical protein J6B24_09065 [Clostridia bacterium]|nr:hypothetical protein [Clostridia bacterium]